MKDIVSEKGIKGAVFDIDGTLIDSMPIWRDVGARYLRRKNIRPEDNLGEILFPMTIAEGIAYVKKTYRLEESPEEIRDGLMEEVALFYKETVPLKAGVKEVLDYLKGRGIPMMLATVGDPSLARAALTRLGVLDYFQGLVTCEELNTTKNEPLIYLECARKMGTEPGETLVFEDVYHGIHSARMGGFVVVAVEDGESEKDRERIMAEADYYVRKVDDLLV